LLLYDAWTWWNALISFYGPLMPRNIEIKARIESVEALLPLVSSISERGPFEIVQDDTFFTSPSGRLKLRVFSPHEGELIFYQRPDHGGPKESRYSI